MAIVDVLTKHGADPTVRDDKYMRPADVACNTHVGAALERAYWSKLASRATSRDWAIQQRKLMKGIINLRKAGLYGIRSGSGVVDGIVSDIRRVATQRGMGADPRIQAMTKHIAADRESNASQQRTRIITYSNESIRLVEQARSLKELRSLLEKRDRSGAPEHWEKNILNKPATSRKQTGLNNGAGKGQALKKLVLELGKGVTMKLVLIPAGKFLMGSPETEIGHGDDEGPQYQITISKPFYMGVTEVTQAQWRTVMGTEPWSNKSYAKSGETNAASHICWDDATAFCTALSKKTGRTVRLPTEAEWEYACRAGTTTAYSFGDDSSKLGGYAWYDGKAHDKDKMYTHPVGTKKPNAWGLYDMHGNVYEWCTDWYDDSYVNAGVRDPMGPATGTYRLARGGSWYGGPQRCRAAYRGRLTPDVRIHVYGFRVVIASRSDVDNTVSTQSRPLAPTPNRGRQLSLNLADGVTMKLVRIKAGKFTRAATKYWSKERPVQQVTLAMPFYMGVTEVTQTQWKAVMKTQPWPQYSSIAGDTAANYINWWDATAFCTALSKKTGRTVRLPTEAEWEYACRAGTTTAYSFGDDPGRVKDRKFVYELGDYAWYEGNTDNRPQPVGKKKPNPWGLYDMHGNVSEWCTDWYAKLYANKGICNPKGPATLRPPGYESTKALFHNHLRHICFAQTLSHAERYHESA